ncbi:DUF1601 domain-containing protein [Coxiella burnetii]|uniref:DUF1601 domain-containing protein n=1 Tax=Coxiella burnetii TaxID=777 RepID=UPI0002E3D47D|nr:DUF1601 domain-containing protein [Coxiella burnetii]
MWALATMGVRWRELEVRELTDRLLEAVRYNASRFKSREIANALWGLARMGMKWPELKAQGLSDRLLEAVHRNAEQLNPQQIANTLWALAMMTVSWEYLQEQRLDQLLLNLINQNANQFSLEESTQIVWGAYWFDIPPPSEILLKVSHMDPPRSSHLHRRVASILSAQTPSKMNFLYKIASTWIFVFLGNAS